MQELKIRKGTGRGRGRRSKREADDEDLEETEKKEEQEENFVDEGDFGFVEVWQADCSRVRDFFPRSRTPMVRERGRGERLCWIGMETTVTSRGTRSNQL